MIEVKMDVPASAPKLDVKHGLARRNSTGNFDTLPATTKVIPHYLRASNGSCHDLCKVGFLPHVVETKERNHATERYSHVVDKTQYQGRNDTNPVSKKKKLDYKIQTPYKAKVILEDVPEPTKKMAYFSDLKIKPVKTKVISVTAPSRLSVHCTEVSELILPKVLGVLQASSTNTRSKEKVASTKSSKNTQTHLVSPKASLQKSWSTRLPSLSEPKKLSRRLSEIIIPSVQNNASNIRNSEIETITKSCTPLSAKSPTKHILIKKTRKTEDLLKVFPLNDENDSHFAETKEQSTAEAVPEKILFVIEPQEKNDSLTCHSPLSDDQNTLPAFPSHMETTNLNTGVSDATSSITEETKAKKQTCKAESPQSTLCSPDCSNDQINPFKHEQKPRRLRRVSSENRMTLQKVKFVRGKELDLQVDDNTPRKVKFRQGSLLENQNGKAENRGRKLRRLVSDVVSDKVKTGPAKKVSLRHQEVKRKMTSSRSFNNVIEETASKLVESRKSKVKALVGAFETVISLQDSKNSNEIATDG
jgi:hypothetical protein